MFERHLRFLRALTDGFVAASEHDKLDALKPWELELRFSNALMIYQAIVDFDERVAQEVLAGHVADDRALADGIRTLYGDWERQSPSLVARLKVAEAAGEKLAGAEPFKEAVLDVRSVLSLTLDQLDESARQFRSGQKRSMGEVVDAIRRRVGA